MSILSNISDDGRCLADKLQTAVPLSQTLGDNNLVAGLRNGTTGAFLKRYHVDEIHTAVDLVNHTDTFPASLNTGNE